MRTLLATFLFFSTSGALLFSEFSDAAAAQNQTCNHFSEDYSALGCFFAAGSSNGGFGGTGGSDGYECPGGAQASCVECDGNTCQWACSGGLSCKFFKQGDGERACATSRVCRTL